MVWIEVALRLEITKIQIYPTINNLIPQDVDNPSLGYFRRYTSKDFVLGVDIVEWIE